MVSIIIPIYNSESYIERSICSVLFQDYSAVELILVDDGSTDSSFDTAIRLSKQDFRLHVYHQSNSGASSARNKGLSVAAGDFVMFVDSDDWINPEMLSEMLKVFEENPEIDVVQTKIPGDFKQQKREGFFSRDEAVKALLEGSWWGPVCKLIRRSSIGDLRFPKKTISEDYFFNYKLFSKIGSLYYVDKCYYHRTDSPGSLSKIGLSTRKFDEFYNVKAVYDSVVVDYPQYRQLAEVHLAGSCLKLLFMVFENNAESEFQEETKDICACLHNNYWSFIKNTNIPLKERVLLSLCFSRSLAKFSERIYHRLVHN